MRNSRKLPLTLTAMALAISLVACGGGSDSDSTSSASTTQLSGVAATGAAMAKATITVYDKTGSTKTTTAGSDGAYSLDVTGMIAPLMIVAEAEDHSLKLVSLLAEISGSAVTGNINELTDLASTEVALAAGKSGSLDLISIGSTSGLDAATIKAKIQAVLTAYQEVLAYAGVDTSSFNPVTSTMKADGTGFDKALDIIDFDRNSSGKTVLSIPKVQVPALAYDDTSISLVWEKPKEYADISDYEVFINGTSQGMASANNTANSKAKPYIDQFYTDDAAGFHTKVKFLNFTAKGLSPDTTYTFAVKGIKSDNSKIDIGLPVSQKTATAFTNVYNVATLGASGNGSTVNTTIIQNAIDTCAAQSTSAYGCKVLIPSDAASGKVFVTGALFLKSNMTLEIADGATLRGSADSADYPLAKGYQLYSYFTNSTDDRRPPSLLNLLSDKRNGSAARTDHNGYDDTRAVFANVRVVGGGTLDGNGWSRGTDLVDEVGNSIAQYPAGSSSKWSTLGILAKSQMEAAQTEVGGTLDSTQNSNFYSNRRSSLTTFRGVQNMYFGGLTLLNPAYHGVMFLESENIVFANTSSQTFDVNNGDGVEFGSSDNAWVYNNFFDTGDDNVNFAAGQGKDYEGKESSQKVRVFNNYMREGHGMLALGSHTGAWIKDILCEDNVAYLTDNGLRMKSTPATGGGAKDVVFRDNAMRSVGANKAVSTAGGITFTDGGGSGNAFIFTLSYSAGSNVFENASASAQFKDITVKNITLDNVDSSKGGNTIKVDAYDGIKAISTDDPSLTYPETFHENITFNSVKIKDGKATSISRLKDSTFKDVSVTISGAEAPASWWAISDSTGNTFDTDTVKPLPAAQ